MTETLFQIAFSLFHTNTLTRPYAGEHGVRVLVQHLSFFHNYFLS